MRGPVGWGAVVGFVVGLGVDGLIFGPRFATGDTYEIGDPLLVMGVPVLVVVTALGTVVGAVVPRRGSATEDMPGNDGAGSRTSGTAVAVVVAVVALAFAAGFFLWGTGLTG